MTTLTIKTDDGLETQGVHAQATFVECLMQAMMAALPAFLTAFTTCLGGGGNQNPGGYNPGNRRRC